MRRLAELERERELLELRLNELNQQIRSAKLAEVQLAYGVCIGCIVKNSVGVEHKVTEIKTWMDGKPWVSGNPRKKDGTFGTAHRNLYSDWEVA